MWKLTIIHFVLGLVEAVFKSCSTKLYCLDPATKGSSVDFVRICTFGLSKQYYSYNIQNVHILTMSTELPFVAGSKQYNFVLHDLKTASNKSEYKVANCQLPHTFLYLFKYMH